MVVVAVMMTVVNSQGVAVAAWVVDGGDRDRC